jgi:hypothetical protein
MGLRTIIKSDESVVQKLHRIWYRKALILAWALILAFIGWISLEYLSYVNFTTIEAPLEAQNFAQIAGATGTTILTFGLLLLYDKQTQIQRQGFKPHLTGEVDSLHITSSQFVIRNTGGGHAYQVKANWEVADYSRTWEIPSLAPGQEYGFPVIVDENGNWQLATKEIEDYLDKNNASSKIDYDIECENQFGFKEYFSGTVDFSSVSTRSGAHEIWEQEPIEKISSEMEDIQDDLGKLVRYEKNRRSEEKWKNRLSQNEAIERIILNKGELSKYEIHRFTGIREETLEYRLSELDEVGAVEYNERKEKARPPSDEGANMTLSEF